MWIANTHTNGIIYHTHICALVQCEGCGGGGGCISESAMMLFGLGNVSARLTFLDLFVCLEANVVHVCV